MLVTRLVTQELVETGRLLALAGAGAVGVGPEENGRTAAADIRPFTAEEPTDRTEEEIVNGRIAIRVTPAATGLAEEAAISRGLSMARLVAMRITRTRRRCNRFTGSSSRNRSTRSLRPTVAEAATTATIITTTTTTTTTTAITIMVAEEVVVVEVAEVRALVATAAVALRARHPISICRPNRLSLHCPVWTRRPRQSAEAARRRRLPLHLWPPHPVSFQV